MYITRHPTCVLLLNLVSQHPHVHLDQCIDKSFNGSGARVHPEDEQVKETVLHVVARSLTLDLLENIVLDS